VTFPNGKSMQKETKGSKENYAVCSALG